jgi:hypothetical protein
MNQPSGAALNALTPAEQATGWQLLFDGNSLKGWVGGHHQPITEDVWTVEDGMLALVHPLSGFGSIYTERNFDNFDLKLEWKISAGGNSGVKYLLKRRPEPDWASAFNPPLVVTVITALPALLLAALALRRVSVFKRRPVFRLGLIAAALLGVVALIGAYGMKAAWDGRFGLVGYEYQIADDSQEADARSTPTHATAAVYDLIAPTNKHLFPVGEFNETEILVKGNHVEHWLNGYKVAEFELGSPQMKQLLLRSKFREIYDMNEKVIGPIMLQNHSSRVWFRNIRIRPF